MLLLICYALSSYGSTPRFPLHCSLSAAQGQMLHVKNDFVFKASGAGYSNGNYPQVWPFALPISCRHKVDCSKFRRFTSCKIVLGQHANTR